MDSLLAGMTLDGSSFDLELTSLELTMKRVTDDERRTGLTFKVRIAPDKVRIPYLCD